MQFEEYGNANYLGNHLIAATSVDITTVDVRQGTKTISCGAFKECDSLTSIKIPDSVTSIGGYAFSDCSSLTIYAEADEKPQGWNGDWNPDNRPVVWGYTGK